MYSENYKTLLKEIEDLNTCKDNHYSWIRRLNIAKMAIQSKTIYKFNAIFMKIPRFIFKNIKAHLKVHMVYQGTPNNQTILKRVTKLDDSGFIVSKLTAKILIKIV